MYIARLLFIKTEIRQVYNPFKNWILHLLCSIIFFVSWRVKNLSTGWGGGGGIGELSWNCNFNIYLDIQVYYLDIQAITTLLCLYWFHMCCFLLFIQIVCYNRSPEKWRVPTLKSLRLPEFWTYKDGTRFILKRNKVSIQKFHK